MRGVASQPVTTSQLKRLEAELESLRSGLDHAQRLAALGTLTGLIAHEFNNLLTPVLSYTKAALADPENRGLAYTALQRASTGAEQAAQIATAILALAREDGSGGATAAHFERADVHEGVRAALACLARDPAKDGIELLFHVKHGEMAAAMKPVAFQQVMLNLILNARKAMMHGGLERKRLCIEAERSEQFPAVPTDSVRSVGDRGSLWSAHGWVTVRVSDSGCGMDSARLRALFAPPKGAMSGATGLSMGGVGGSVGGGVGAGVGGADAGQSGGSASGASGGAIGAGLVSETGAVTGAASVAGVGGLGLTVCRRLTEDAGGLLWARSVVGEGTTVAVVVPRAPNLAG